MKNILALTDYSTVAENAIEAAFVFSKNYGSNLFIYHNTVDKEFTEYNLSQLRPIKITSPHNSNQEIVSRWRDLGSTNKKDGSLILGSGDIMKNINAIIEKHDIDIIIMGSTGAGGKEEYIWGSNTEKVILEVDCPVLVIKSPMKDYRIDNIVFASSFDQNEREAFQYGLNLLSPPKDDIIHLLSIDTLSYFTQPTIVMKQAMKEFEKLATPYKVQSHFYKDYSIDSGIRHFLQETKPDVLIMSNKNTNLLKRFFQGSNTTRAVNHVEFPVLTINYK